MQQLFICAIGPIQDFIATARRSRDLWYGSWMLSELSKAAAKALADRAGLDNLVFPAPASSSALEPGSPLNVANKIVAVTRDAPTDLGRVVRVAIEARLDRLREDAFSRVHGVFDQELAERQLADMVEYYWASAEMVDTADYAGARETAEALLAARKTTRDFKQFDGAAVPKSSLDGSRESVIPETAYPSRQDSALARASKLRRLYTAYGARRGERLSGVDLLKRLGMRGSEEEPKFRSTSHMAALPFMAMVDRNEGAGAAAGLLARVVELLIETEIAPEDKDGSLLYESRLQEWAPDEEKLEALRRGFEALLTDHAGESRPGPYFAMLAADGDQMGAAIDARTSPDAHRELSRALSDFAHTARESIAAHQGVLVYAGGDDILAYLPLHTVLACAGELAAGFARAMGGFTTTKGKAPTLSAGLVVAHHLDPLADALELARDAERTAKTRGGRNALAITVSKRSGVDRTIYGKWDALKPRLDDMIRFQRQGAIARGVAYELQELGRVLTTQDALVSEALRVVRRKRESGGADDTDRLKEVVGQLDKWIGSDGIPVAEIALELIVSGLFADAADLAFGKQTKGGGNP